MKDGLAGICSGTDLLRRKSVGLERACRRTAPETDSAVEKVAVARDAESAADGVERTDGLERACRRTAPEADSAVEKAAVAEGGESASDGVERADAAEVDVRSFARVFGSCFGYLIRARQQR